MPIVGETPVGFDHILYAAAVCAAWREYLEALGDYVLHVAAYECHGIHCRHVYAAVPAVAVVHDVSSAVAYLGRRLRHGGGHESGEVGLDLEIYVVCMGVVEPMARRGRHNAVEDVVPCRLVGMPQGVAGIGEGRSHGVCRRVYAETVYYLDKG